jgi:hypothetical protein
LGIAQSLVADRNGEVFRESAKPDHLPYGSLSFPIDQPVKEARPTEGDTEADEEPPHRHPKEQADQKDDKGI